MPVSALSSLPRTNFRGIQDVSPVNVAMPVESLPIRLPLFMGFAPWGSYASAGYVNAAGLQLLYGSDVISPKSKFFTHQSQFLRSHFTAGGTALFLRLKAPNAKQATFRLALDLIADKVPLYERNGDNSLKLDQDGNKIATGETTDGFRAQWRWVPVTAGTDGSLTFGSADVSVGTLVSTVDGTNSELIPILDGLARWEGARGNNIGFRLHAPTVSSTDPADEDLQNELGAFLYRLQVVERANASSSAQLKRTLQSESYVDFSFKQGTINLQTEKQYYAGKVIKPAYESTNPAAFTGYGPVDKLAVYDAHVLDTLTKLAARESEYTTEDIADPHQFNFLTGVDVAGNPYHTFVVEGPSAGGLLFGELSNLYMVGGADGDITPASYNTVVDEVLSNLDGSDVPFKDIARMPYDSVWDSGFPLDTKKKFANFHNIRPDVVVHACTQDVGRALNTPSEDSSIAISLRSHFRAMQESQEFGTKALRFMVVGQAGYLIEDDYDGLVPFLEFLMILATRYMGAANGEMDSTYAFGRGEQNVVTRYRDHNVVTRDPEVRNNDWNNGLNYTEYFDMSRLFWAGLQSIYEDHTSVLHGYINVCIACNLTRIGHITWRELSGDSQLTDDQFLDEVTARVTTRTSGKYDNRVDITPRAYFTDQDEALGFPWHLDIGMAGDNIRTVENLAVIASRRRVLEETI
jgi:hypothetical protein